MPRPKKKKQDNQDGKKGKKHQRNKKQNQQKQQQTQQQKTEQKKDETNQPKKKKNQPKKKDKIESNDKKKIVISVVGDYKSGKSSVIGRLLYDLRLLDSNEIDRIKGEYKSDSNDNIYRYILMKSKQEILKNYSMYCRYNNFETWSYRYNIIDTPGKIELINEMLIGLSQSDCVLIIVDARKDRFLSSIKAKDDRDGIVTEGYVRKCIGLCSIFGIENIIFGVNMMDEYNVNYNERRFYGIKKELEPVLTKYGFKHKKIPFIPISGMNGDNIIKKSNKMKWFSGFYVTRKGDTIKGQTLMDAMEDAVKPPKRHKKKPLRIPITGVYKIKGVGNVVTGKIEQGTLKINNDIKIYPTNVETKAIQIKWNNDDVKEAKDGDIIGINIGNWVDNDKIPKIGDVICLDDEKIDGIEGRNIVSFTALVAVQDTYGKIYQNRYTCSMQIRTKMVTCVLYKIKWKMGKNTNNKKMDKNVEYLESGDQAECIFVPLNDIFVETFDDCKRFGRIAFFKQKYLIMMGKCIKVEHTKRLDIQTYNEYQNFKQK